MKIVVVGTRGYPGISGGVETHCEQIYPRLSSLGFDVTVIRRKSYVENTRNISPKSDDKVKFIDINAPHSKTMEAFVHTLRGVFKAKALHADIVHIHAIGPSLCAPIGKMLGLKVICTNHGPDYERKKWGWFSKLALRIGEYMQVKFGDEVISISPSIQDSLKNKYDRSSHLILNGVDRPRKTGSTAYISSLGLEPGKFVLGLGRFVEEKNFHHLINAFSMSEHNDYKLVIAGDADHHDAYQQQLLNLGRAKGAIMPGFVKGEQLNELLTHAALFVLPSSHEGLPISLLEAMSYGLDVLVSDIPANRLPSLDSDDFFPEGDIYSLANNIQRKLENPRKPRKYDLMPYNWDAIAEETARLYVKVLNKQR